MTKAKKITLSVFLVLLAAAPALFIWWYIQGRTAMDDAAAQVERNEDMVFVNDRPQYFVKDELYDDLFGENGDETLSFLPQVTIDEEEALQIAMDFFERYKLDEGYPVKKTDIYMNDRTGDRCYHIDIEIDKPRPKYIINKYVIRKNVYRFFVNDSGVLYLYLQ